MNKHEKALLIVAHGSRRQASNDEVNQLAASINEHNANAYALTKSAFLELCEPSIPDGLIDLIDQGYEEIDVFPYFLSAGRHVAEDIPAEVNQVVEKYPSIKINMIDYLGSIQQIPDIIIEHCKSS